MELITLKSPREQEAMRRAGRLAAQARALAGSMVRPGVTTKEIDDAVRRFIRGHGAEPSFLGQQGFSGSACISVNQVVIHGIPSRRIIIREGDIVSIDVGAFIDGVHGDCAATYPCGATYHVKAAPPKVEGVCDACGGKLVQRDDDKPETVQDRLSVYHAQTEPLKEFYAERGILKSVDNQPTIGETTRVITAALGI